MNTLRELINLPEVEKELGKRDSEIQTLFIHLEHIRNEIYFNGRGERNALPVEVEYYQSVRWSTFLWEQDFEKRLKQLDELIVHANHLEALVRELEDE